MLTLGKLPNLRALKLIKKCLYRRGNNLFFWGVLSARIFEIERVGLFKRVDSGGKCTAFLENPANL